MGQTKKQKRAQEAKQFARGILRPDPETYDAVEYMPGERVNELDKVAPDSLFVNVDGDGIAEGMIAGGRSNFIPRKALQVMMNKYGHLFTNLWTGLEISKSDHMADNWYGQNGELLRRVMAKSTEQTAFYDEEAAAEYARQLALGGDGAEFADRYLKDQRGGDPDNDFTKKYKPVLDKYAEEFRDAAQSESSARTLAAASRAAEELNWPHPPPPPPGQAQGESQEGDGDGDQEGEGQGQGDGEGQEQGSGSGNAVPQAYLKEQQEKPTGGEYKQRTSSDIDWDKFNEQLRSEFGKEFEDDYFTPPGSNYAPHAMRHGVKDYVKPSYSMGDEKEDHAYILVTDAPQFRIEKTTNVNLLLAEEEDRKGARYLREGDVSNITWELNIGNLNVFERPERTTSGLVVAIDMSGSMGCFCGGESLEGRSIEYQNNGVLAMQCAAAIAERFPEAYFFGFCASSFDYLIELRPGHMPACDCGTFYGKDMLRAAENEIERRYGGRLSYRQHWSPKEVGVSVDEYKKLLGKAFEYNHPNYEVGYKGAILGGNPDCTALQHIRRMLNNQFEGAAAVIISDGQPSGSVNHIKDNRRGSVAEHTKKLAAMYHDMGLRFASVLVGGYWGGIYPDDMVTVIPDGNEIGRLAETFDYLESLRA